jgi:integrase
MARRAFRDGGIDTRTENVHRLRYRLNGRRFTVTFHGSLAEARKELRRLIRSGDTGEHIAPDKVTLATWIDRWFVLLNRQQAKGETRRRGLVSNRTIERYEQLLIGHVVPALGRRPLQSIQASEIDQLYVALEKKLASRTVAHLHSILGACLKVAVRKGLIATSPVARAEVPKAEESNHGQVLDAEGLRTLIEGFRGSSLFPIVATLALTGARRNEVLALQWDDLDVGNKTLRIERAVEQTAKYDLATKEPKTRRGVRTITVDDDLIALLLSEREKLLRIFAGVPDGTTVDLSLVKLPAGALMFPAPPAPGADTSFTALRTPSAVTKAFLRKVKKLGFPGLRLHDLRGSHETLLLDNGTPIHVVAARCGHDPAVMLRSYAKKTKKADDSAAAIMGQLSKGLLG